MSGKLYLIPTTLGDCPINSCIPEFIKDIINSIDYYIVENERTARRYLRKLNIKTPIDNLKFYVLNKYTSPAEFNSFLKPIFINKDMGLISEAGSPGVADPGAEIVKLAHMENIRVIPLVGPSSILLALMASGLNGQNFAFAGYLPIKRYERISKIKFLENLSKKENQTQIFMEAPYRNQNLLEDIVNACNSDTHLCLATDITLKTECIKTKTMKEWKKKRPSINKRPTIFLLHKY